MAVSALALTAAPAFAGTNAHGFSYHEEGLGVQIEHAEGWFLHSGDDWKVCDVLADGDRAVIVISWPQGPVTRAESLSATGGAGTCVTGGAGIDIPEGTRVKLEVWHQTGPSGTPKDRKSYSGTA
ncbi:hypothetical protein [Streptomyces sp. NPDC006307]|uniref:hypothetical protein n=1 Tax=Streptomyces sp. NPDC006307 TaxID=3156748 RepID=UPI0033A1BD3F